MLELLKGLGPSVIRTVVPLLVALFTSWLVKLGIDPGPYEDLIAQLAGGLVALAYYVAVRVFEMHVAPRLGWLLGLPKQPTYDAPAAPSEQSPTGYEATPDTPGIPEGEPVDVIPADPAAMEGDSALGDPLAQFGGSARLGIETIAREGLTAPVDPLDGPNEDYTSRH